MFQCRYLITETRMRQCAVIIPSGTPLIFFHAIQYIPCFLIITISDIVSGCPDVVILLIAGRAAAVAAPLESTAEEILETAEASKIPIAAIGRASIGTGTASCTAIAIP